MALNSETTSTTTSSSLSSKLSPSQSQEEPQSPPEFPSEPLTTTLTRFLTLYVTTLFSLDNITAARQSPHSIPPTDIPEELRRTGRGTDFGEGVGVGFRMDPGGRPRRDIGRVNGGGGGDGIVVPACKGCKYSAAPTIG